MMQVKKEGIILEKTALGFECEGVLNPAVIYYNNEIHLFYRAVSKGNYSSIGYCILSTPLTVKTRSDAPLLFPQFDYEKQGMEDPRIVQIDNFFYLSYTAYDGINAMGALAISKNLFEFEKKGIIVPQITFNHFSHLASAKDTIGEKYLRYNDPKKNPDISDHAPLLWDKNLIFFPERIQGKLYFIHRIKPDILITSINEIEELTVEFWEKYFLHFNNSIMLAPKYDHEVSYVGGGCPPIKTAKGWLIIYHGVHDTIQGYIYAACAALFDLNNPQIEIARLPYALFKPEEKWELKGTVNNVCFPSGALVQDGTLYLYYGAADERIGCASVNLNDLLNELLLYTGKNEN